MGVWFWVSGVGEPRHPMSNASHYVGIGNMRILSDSIIDHRVSGIKRPDGVRRRFLV